MVLGIYSVFGQLFGYLDPQGQSQIQVSSVHTCSLSKGSLLRLIGAILALFYGAQAA